MGFFSSGWAIKDGVVTIPNGIDPWVGYRFILEAIYDGHLPVTRVIGYHINTSSANKRLRESRIFERDQNCADDRLTIAANLSHLLVLDYNTTLLHTEIAKGVIKVSNTVFTFSRHPVLVLSSRDYIVTALNELSLDLVVSTATGYSGADVNYKKIMEQRGGRTAKTRYFPVYSYHNIIDFVSVLPFAGGNQIRLRYKYGVTDDVLMQMFECLFSSTETGEWHTKYREVLR